VQDNQQPSLGNRSAWLLVATLLALSLVAFVWVLLRRPAYSPDFALMIGVGTLILGVLLIVAVLLLGGAVVKWLGGHRSSEHPLLRIALEDWRVVVVAEVILIVVGIRWIGLLLGRLL
jgi:hypothetical protein